ncbi:tail fiber assembly protein from lambdoid prophage [Escherichia coli]|uniref:Tail fiber assembly protein from lambdoid prophage n=1 Tax=Escherichia coli TaxID=562 RepID=A0A377ALD4_ECOLX|nr:tail fiber assembly protein from lambdoid prophage [Escherichia coli]
MKKTIAMRPFTQLKMAQLLQWIISVAIKDGYVTLSPLTPYDKWDGEKWVTDTEAQHSAAVEAAEAQRQSLIDAAMASISLIQLKLQAGRKLTQPENTRLNAVLDYIDAVTATEIPAQRRTSSGLKLPEA